MAEQGAYTLYDLKSRLDHGGDTMLKVLEGVNNYFEGVKDVLRQQVELLENQWREAQEQLSRAEEAYSSCLASQRYDEEDGEYHPSCYSEQCDVDRARRYEEECRERYEHGRRIQGEVDSEIEKYKAPWGILVPPGAEKFLEHLAKEHTHSAIEKLDKIIEKVEEYLRFGVTMARPGAGQVSIPEDDKGSSNTTKVDVKPEPGAFAAGVQNVINKTKPIESATRVMVCDKCGRPMTLCTCQRLREKEYPY